MNGVPDPIGGAGSGVTTFSAPSLSWPSWLVPTVTTPASTPSLAVAASEIPVNAGGTGATTAAGANLSITGVTQTGTLGTSSQVSTFPGTVAAAATNGENNCAALAWASPLACIQDAATNGLTAFFPPGTYQFAINTALPNNTHIRCASQASILEAVNNAQGDLFTDNGAAIIATIDNCTLSRNGTGVLLPSEAQNPRYTLHMTGVGSTYTLNNVLLTNSNWNLGTVATVGWPGVIALVNESGTVYANASQIVSQARGIYQPDSGHYPLTYWQGGTIFTHHKALSLHAGEMHVVAPIGCVMQNSDIVPGGDSDACLSAYAGYMYETGEVSMHGWGPIVYATNTANVSVVGNGSNGFNYGLDMDASATGSINWTGTVSSLGLGLQNNGTGVINLKGDLHTYTGGPASAAPIGIYATGTGTTNVNGNMTTAYAGITTTGTATPVVNVTGTIATASGYDGADVDTGVITLSGEMLPGQNGVYFTGTSATVVNLINEVILGGALAEIRFQSNTNAYMLLQNVILSGGASWCMDSAVSVGPIDVVGVSCDFDQSVNPSITLRNFGQCSPSSPARNRNMYQSGRHGTSFGGCSNLLHDYKRLCRFQHRGDRKWNMDAIAHRDNLHGNRPDVYGGLLVVRTNCADGHNYFPRHHYHISRRDFDALALCRKSDVSPCHERQYASSYRHGRGLGRYALPA